MGTCRRRPWRGLRLLLMLIIIAAAPCSDAARGNHVSQGGRPRDSPAADLLKSHGLSSEDIHKVHARYLQAMGQEVHAENEGTTSHFADFRSGRDWLNLLGVILCVCFGATAAGLTLGLVSLDPLELELKYRAGTPLERQQAKKLLPLVKRHHLLLCSLLLFNASANETLPLFLENMVPPYVAIMISVTLVLIFGEIVPSAIFTGPRQLELGAMMSLPTWCIIAFFFPISYPLGVLLDGLLGHEGLRKYTRKELMALVDVQQDLHEDDHAITRMESGDTRADSRAADSPPPPSHLAPVQQGHGMAHVVLVDFPPSHAGGERRRSIASSACDVPLTEQEASMVSGILENHHETVREIMVSVEDCYGVSSDAILTTELKHEIATAGYSRILVYTGHKSNIRGFFHVKKLLLLDTSSPDPIAVTDLPLYQPIIVHEKCTLGSLLTKFKSGRSHMAVVSRDPRATMHALEEDRPLQGRATALGIATLEDVIEMLLQQEIYDEEDCIRRAAHHKALVLLRETQRQGTNRGELLVEGTSATDHGSVFIGNDEDEQKLATLIDELHQEAQDADDAGEEEVSNMTKKLLTEVLSSSTRSARGKTPRRTLSSRMPSAS